MKQITIDWETYQKELEEIRSKAFNDGYACGERDTGGRKSLKEIELEEIKKECFLQGFEDAMTRILCLLKGKDALRSDQRENFMVQAVLREFSLYQLKAKEEVQE